MEMGTRCAWTVDALFFFFFLSICSIERLKAELEVRKGQLWGLVANEDPVGAISEAHAITAQQFLFSLTFLTTEDSTLFSVHLSFFSCVDSFVMNCF